VFGLRSFFDMRKSGASKYRRGAQRPQQRRRKRIATVLAMLSVLALAAGLYFTFDISGPFEAGSTGKIASKDAILKAWTSGDKAAVLDLTRSSIESKPLDPFYLTYRGFAAFYSASEKPEGEEKTALLDESVLSLRKALASGKALPAKAQTEYVLGKTYYAKGEPWYDLAVSYMESSLADGYGGSDGDEYLAALYAGLGRHADAVGHYEKALSRSRAELLLLAAAKSYIATGDKAKAKTLLDEAVASGKDATALQQARFLLGGLAEESGDFSGAEAQYQAALDADPESAEAWYRMGLMYQYKNDPVRARAAWRKAAMLDPTHSGARQKLGEKL